jgi:AcrR family transcriptional regulator
MIARPRSDVKARQILEAARTVLGNKGYAATTISEVAAEAGVSRGLLHYYFESKEDLLARVVRLNLERSLELVDQLFADCRSADELAAGLAGVLRLSIEHDPAFFALFFECWIVGRQSPAVAAEVHELFAEFRRAIQSRLEEAVERGSIAPKLPLDGLAVLLSGLLDGLALQLVSDPELAAADSTWQDVEHSIRLLLGAET